MSTAGYKNKRLPSLFKGRRERTGHLKDWLQGLGSGAPSWVLPPEPKNFDFSQGANEALNDL